MVKRLFAPRPVPAAFARFPKELVFRPSQIRAIAEDALLQVPAAASRQQYYKRIEAPTVIIAGDRDGYVDFTKQSVRLGSDIRDSVLVRVPGHGHMIHYTAPDAVMNAIERVRAQVSESEPRSENRYVEA